jgi:hypothetical protein
MSQKSGKTAAELESMITAELREHPECDSAGVVVIRPMGLSWDAALVGAWSPLGFAKSSIWPNSYSIVAASG